MISKKLKKQIIQRICIGGCNWDAMMLWMYNDGNAPTIDVKNQTPNDICEGTPMRNFNEERSRITGCREYDKLANIYDLLGCTYDCGMEREWRLSNKEGWRLQWTQWFELAFV